MTDATTFRNVCRSLSDFPAVPTAMIKREMFFRGGQEHVVAAVFEDGVSLMFPDQDGWEHYEWGELENAADIRNAVVELGSDTRTDDTATTPREKQ